MKSNDYSRNVFINCPFDDEYKRFFYTIIFVVHDSGLIARCSLEIADSSENRIDKITRIISECKYGINDLSRIELDSKNKLPRFNMPFELGLFIGCKKFGNDVQKRKSCLIIDKDKYLYQKFLSDISGFDIFYHSNKFQNLIVCIRNWLQAETRSKSIPSANLISKRYNKFLKKFPLIIKSLENEKNEKNYLYRFSKLCY